MLVVAEGGNVDPALPPVEHVLAGSPDENESITEDKREGKPHCLISQPKELLSFTLFSIAVAVFFSTFKTLPTRKHSWCISINKVLLTLPPLTSTFFS